MEVELFEVNGGWGYRVGGVVQPYHPGLEGGIPMTLQEAQELGAETLARLQE